jgi:hypothetical protein
MCATKFGYGRIPGCADLVKTRIKLVGGKVSFTLSSLWRSVLIDEPKISITTRFVLTNLFLDPISIPVP